MFDSVDNVFKIFLIFFFYGGEAGAGGGEEVGWWWERGGGVGGVSIQMFVSIQTSIILRMAYCNTALRFVGYVAVEPDLLSPSTGLNVNYLHTATWGRRRGAGVGEGHLGGGGSGSGGGGATLYLAVANTGKTATS